MMHVEWVTVREKKIIPNYEGDLIVAASTRGHRITVALTWDLGL